MMLQDSPVRQLMEANELAERLAEPDLVVVQVTGIEAYMAHHIEGARLIVPQALVCGIPPASGKLPSKTQLDQVFSAAGLASNEHWVLCDDEGGGWAGRLAWTLDVIGHHNWSYLNGGLHAWQAAGQPLVSGEPAAVAATTVDCQIDRAPAADIDGVRAAIEDPEQLIWDVRSAAEYLGERSAAARPGRVPGAVNLDWLDLKDPQDHQRLFNDIEQRLANAGVDRNKRIITHCQTHHRSGLSYMLGRILGWDIRAYDGSWSEWGNRDDTPIETGAP